ncbi:hypothetical protein FH972_018818 [Carpinus fangiana]|uniref:TF-B3 domain-containing protein n=1 Tax=Carpinus fangiana TaxID=176857 RepID=A0A5N6RQE1_9ROSI|nr:hypothetical protein FH972_018818 [Carpinus fangiana]
MEVNGLLSQRDFEGIHVDPTLSDLDKLLLVAEVASSKYEAQEKEEKKSKRKEANHSMMRSNKRRKLDMATLPMPPPDLPEEFKERIKALGGNQAEMVIQKYLYESDLDRNKSRLSIPFVQSNEGCFLREKEKTDLEKPKATILVPFIEPSGKCHEMSLGWWNMRKGPGKKSSSTYVLKSNWNMVLKANGLGLEDVSNEGCFFREKEKTHLEKPKATILVPFIEPSGKCHEMSLGWWNMRKGPGKKSSSTYVLKSNWNMVLKANGLGLEDVVQVWSFRVDPLQQKLGLALVVVSRSGGNQGGRDGGEGEEDAGNSYKAN